MSRHKQVQLLLAKATQDQYVLDKLLDDPAAPEEVFGFHAQQAAEKLLKALLAGREIEFPLTHRIQELMDLAADNGIGLPEALDEIRYLTPFAVEFRYDVIPEEPEAPLNKSDIRNRIRDLRAWVESQVASEQEPKP